MSSVGFVVGAAVNDADGDDRKVAFYLGVVAAAAEEDDENDEALGGNLADSELG